MAKYKAVEEAGKAAHAQLGILRKAIARREESKMWDRTRRCCGNCDHWALSALGTEWWSTRDDMNPQGNHGTGLEGDCRYDPPHWLTADNMGRFPLVKRDDWCGKFKPRAVAQR